MIVHKSNLNIIKFSETNVLLISSVIMQKGYIHEIPDIIPFHLEAAMFKLVRLRKYFL